MKNIFKNPSFKLVLAIIIVAVVFGGYYGYKALSERAEKIEERTERTKACKVICVYVPSIKAWRIETIGLDTPRFFPDQEQCIDYCLGNK